ncbi:MAG TPA: hypothetical protein VG819_03825 [Rhizomicrobium sp.]|jgi:hypothetical protein|nr:hypothetical protein [Rhizomicrobium sp.]
MQTLANIAFGAFLAGATLGPSAWTDIARAESWLARAAMSLAGSEDSRTPFAGAVARVRAALPALPGHAH